MNNPLYFANEGKNNNRQTIKAETVCLLRPKRRKGKSTKILSAQHFTSCSYQYIYVQLFWLDFDNPIAIPCLLVGCVIRCLTKTRLWLQLCDLKIPHLLVHNLTTQVQKISPHPLRIQRVKPNILAHHKTLAIRSGSFCFPFFLRVVEKGGKNKQAAEI